MKTTFKERHKEQIQQQLLVLKTQNPAIEKMLSPRAKSMCFPLGIVAQVAASKRYQAEHVNKKPLNADIGIVKISHTLAVPPCILQNDAPSDHNYAPSPGLPKLRRAIENYQEALSPKLKNRQRTTPIVTHGSTFAGRIAAEMFVPDNTEVIVPDMYWPNHLAIFDHAIFKTFPSFTSAKQFNTKACIEALDTSTQETIVLMLTSPNNPTGHALSNTEAMELQAAISAWINKTKKQLVIITDDAYGNLSYEDTVYPESISTLFCEMHEQILVVKLDSFSKVLGMYGDRMGAISLFGKGLTQESAKVLENIMTGFVRRTLSNCTKSSQLRLLGALNAETLWPEIDVIRKSLKARYKRVTDLLSNNKESFGEHFTVIPFNSALFFCLQLRGEKSSKMVQESLLKEHPKYSISIIDLGNKTLRIAWSLLEENEIEVMLKTLIQIIKS